MILTEYKKRIYEDFLSRANSKEGLYLGNIPKSFLTTELCLAAVKRNGANLHFVPEEFKSVEVCEAALQNKAWVLKLIPEEFLYCLGLYDKKLRTKQELLEIYSTEELLTSKNAYLRELGKKKLEEAVRHKGSLFQYVPEEFKTLELCKIAIGNNKWNEWILEFVPIEFLNETELEFCGETSRVKLLSEQEIVERYGIEGLLTSDKPYLRELGKKVLK